MNGNPQPEEGYTRIANELFEAILKFPFTKRELKILLYMVRYSYGFNQKEVINGASSFSKIAEETGIALTHIRDTIESLIKKNVVTKTVSGYKINKHYKRWEGKVTKMVSYQNGKLKVTKTVNGGYQNGKLDSKEKQTQKEKKDPLKKSIKKTYKEKNITSTNVDVSTKKPNPVYQLVEDFALFRNIPLDRGFINKNVQHAKRLLKQYPPEFIAQVIKWRLEHDDGFWHSKLNNLGIVYTHIAEWIGEMKRGKKIISFKKFLEQNPHLDYRDLEKGSKEREIALWRALREAYKSGYVEFTPKMLEVYKSFIEDFERRK